LLKAGFGPLFQRLQDMTYAIISVGGKQHRVREGERLLVDRLPFEEGATFEPEVLLIGGDGQALLGSEELGGRLVTARVAAHVLGKKVIVGKHKRRTGYRRRNGFRARLSQIEIQSIGAKPARASRQRAAKAVEPTAEAAAPAAEPKATPARKPRTPRAKPSTATGEGAAETKPRPARRRATESKGE
jgi:large subunit ribosomal protein L21